MPSFRPIINLASRKSTVEKTLEPPSRQGRQEGSLFIGVCRSRVSEENERERYLIGRSIRGESDMGLQTRDKFLWCVERSELIDRNQLAKAVAEIDTTDPQAADDCDRLADALIDRKLLTRWQVENLRLGKSAGFILGQYKILGLLGSGQSGKVYLAEHRFFLRLRVLKILPVSRVNDTLWTTRFYNGAFIGSRVNHRNVAETFDIGAHKRHHFIVMEYVEGDSLQSIVAKQGALEWPAAVDYIRQAAEALAHLHATGIVHRDLKPSHLMVDNQGTVRLIDFSLARRIEESRASTLEANVDTEWGTVGFLAPEQGLDPSLVDRRTDIYSLGCTLYFLLTGHPPFAPRRNIVQRILMHQAADPPDVSVSRPDVPPKLANLCSRMMARSPDARPQTAAVVVSELAEIH